MVYLALVHHASFGDFVLPVVGALAVIFVASVLYVMRAITGGNQRAGQVHDE